MTKIELAKKFLEFCKAKHVDIKHNGTWPDKIQDNFSTAIQRNSEKERIEMA